MKNVIWRFSAVSKCSSFIWVTHLVNKAQFLNAKLVFSSPLVAVISPVTNIYGSEQSKILDYLTLVSNLMLKSSLIPSPYAVLFWSLMTYHFFYLKR